jgi:hypothetical protein
LNPYLQDKGVDELANFATPRLHKYTYNSWIRIKYKYKGNDAKAHGLNLFVIEKKSRFSIMAQSLNI